MRLSDKERDILACAELRAEIPIQKLRKQTGYREHTIRYHLHRLMERGVIVPLPFINLHALGFTIFNLFFSIGAAQKKVKQDFHQALYNSKHVVWLAEMGGDFQYGLGFAATTIAPLLELLTGLSKKFPNIFFEKAFSCQSQATIFYRKYLSSKEFDVPPLTTKYTQAASAIDELDDKILTALALPRRISHRQLAQEIRVPLSTVELRIRKLEEKKIIAGYIFGVDPAKFGMLSFKLLVYAKGINPEFSASLLKFAESHPRIVYMIECIGNWDVEIGVEVEEPQQVTEIIQDIFDRFGGAVNTIKVLTKLKDIKFRWYPGG